ncbi:MAG TPA: hypothetical protein VF111_12390 [Thermoanaerobaculia bacterium]
MKRLLIAFVIALFLPFPGPHIDEYIPVIRTLFGGDGNPGFFVLVAILLTIYTAVVWGVLWLVFRGKR